MFVLIKGTRYTAFQHKEYEPPPPGFSLHIWGGGGDGEEEEMGGGDGKEEEERGMGYKAVDGISCQYGLARGMPVVLSVLS